MFSELNLNFSEVATFISYARSYQGFIMRKTHEAPYEIIRCAGEFSLFVCKLTDGQWALCRFNDAALLRNPEILIRFERIESALSEMMDRIKSAVPPNLVDMNPVI
jgi:hypothetical protein